MKKRLLLASGIVVLLALALGVAAFLREGGGGAVETSVAMPETTAGSEEASSVNRASGPAPVAPSPAAVKEPVMPGMVTIADPDLVFQKAFWRRTSPGDTILHAERREWFDAEARLVRWQWFLVFAPASETLAWLQTNPFLLAPVERWEAPAAPDESPPPPAWFLATDFAEHTLYQGVGRHHRLALAHDGSRVTATDSGPGFEPKQ